MPETILDERRPVRICFSDFPGETNPRLIERLLARRYDVHRVERQPDFVIYSVFGNKYLTHDNAARIFVTGENVHPDFNLCDYAFSYDWLEFGDRHYRMPNYVLYDEWADIIVRKRSSLHGLGSKTDFCNFIYSNGDCHPFRDEFFKALNKTKPVDSFGAHLRNSDRTLAPAYHGEWAKAKVESQRSFKFSIAFENSASPGYTTEKIVQALAADTVPIYFGDPLVTSVFNPDRMINANEMRTDELIETVMAVDRDDSRYLSMVNAPFFSQDAPIKGLSPESILDAFGQIIDRPRAQNLRRNPHYFGRKYEDQRRAEARALDNMRRLEKLRFWRRWH